MSGGVVSGGFAVFRAEWFRLTRGRAVWWAAAFLAVLSFLRVWAAFLAERAAYARAVANALQQGRSAPAVLETSNAYGPFVDGWAAGLTVSALLLLILSARVIAGDIEAGLMRLARTRSASRGALTAGRALLGLPLCLGCLAVTAAGSWCGAALLFDFGPVIEFGDVLATPGELNDQLLLVVGTTLPALLATWGFGLLVSALSGSGSTAVGTALVAYLGFDLFKEVMGEARYWVFAAFNPSFVDNSYVAQVASMARGFSDAGFSDALLRQNLVLPWPEALLLMALAGVVLQRRSL